MDCITSNQNPLVKYLVRLRTESSFRKAEKKLLLVGKTMLDEARRLGLVQQTIGLIGCDVLVTEDVLKKITGLPAPDGVCCLIAYPEFIAKPLRRLLVLDAVSDPGNVGSILRSAYAFGWDAVFFLPGCCDPFNEKALAAARTASLSLPLLHGTLADLKALCAQHALTLLAADLGGEQLEPQSGSFALVLGSEGQGISPTVRHEATCLHIPMQHGFESLNVAAAASIFLYTLK